MVQTAIQCSRLEQHPGTTTPDQAAKKLDLIGHKVYSSAGLQFCILSYQVILVKYDFKSYSRLAEVQASLLEDKQANFKVFFEEGKPVSKVSLQAVNTAARSLASNLVFRRDSWLQISDFPNEVQTTLEDLPFDNQKLFSNKTDESLHSLKDSPATLQS